ncbi:hypothetical protein [Vibrio aphrogenes]|uniref:hypothetical protein n=1 Tax=Vibrio aphrogenes TaxID=1891186 RepID=UPI000B35E4AE|nr:hypothetical protein [Vibrio aphrogenes]
MTFLESITLMLSLIYSGSLLYTGGKKLGAVLLLFVIFFATLATLYWPLLLTLILACVIVTVVHKRVPHLTQVNQRPNIDRPLTHHVWDSINRLC